ncbi:hypothetical protein L0Y49_03240, partial [bacterium]|nr:hypothetical protein [bacterium]
GVSARVAADYYRVFENPNFVIYAPADEAERYFTSRNDRNQSEGNRLVITEHLTATEGGTAFAFRIRGNAVIEHLTNLAHQYDDAVLSRMMLRTKLSGPQTVEDHLDMGRLWHEKIEKDYPWFVNLKKPDGYTWFATQGMVETKQTIGTLQTMPKTPRIAEIFAEVDGVHGRDEHVFLATVFNRVQKVYPKFTARDERNIYDRINGFIMNVDIPKEWMANPKLYFLKSYKVKYGMLGELKEANMKTINLAQLQTSVTIEYLDNMAEIADTDRERRIAALVEEAEIHDEANRRLVQRKEVSDAAPL